jgi:putative transposase
VHYGRAAEIEQVRRQTLLAAYTAHPERFVSKVPVPPIIPAAVWINPPEESQAAKLN